MGEDSHRSERQLIRRRGRPKLGLAIYAFRRHRKVDGPLLRRGRSARRSAQRLSASSKGSLAGDDRLINKRRVLNAFRRHRRVYPRPALPSPPPATCAQRLSASWKGSRWSCLPLGPMRRRAQRRSASSKGSPLSLQVITGNNFNGASFKYSHFSRTRPGFVRFGPMRICTKPRLFKHFRLNQAFPELSKNGNLRSWQRFGQVLRSKGSDKRRCVNGRFHTIR